MEDRKRRWRRGAVEFDGRNFRFAEESRSSIRKAVQFVIGYLLLTLCVAVVAYFLFAIFFSTDSERALRREIRMYERLYPDLAPRVELVTDAVAGLQHKDNNIYEQVFHASAPDVDPIGRLAFLHASDTIPDSELNGYTLNKADRLLAVMSDVDAEFARIFEALGDSSLVVPPMRLPLKDISYLQTGASVGSRLDPFYSACVWHEGIDFIVVRGTPVYATADGIVIGSTSTKKQGNTVEIGHDGGYTTVYAHLESRSVRVGQKVEAGQQIGTVGMTGKSFAPHLHYEVRRDGTALDPVNCFFGSVTPDEYSNMLYMSVNTRQSMD